MFQNLLENLNEPNGVAYKMKLGLDWQEKEKLTEQCLNYVATCAIKSHIPILVCTDSITFLNKVKLIENVFIIPG